MATVAGSRISITLRGAEVVSTPPNKAVASIDQTIEASWADGGSSGATEHVYDVTGTATDTPTVIDLSALPSMAGGSTRDLDRTMFLCVRNTGAGVLLAGGGSTPVIPQVSIPVGGFAVFGFSASAADGLDTSTNKLLSLERAASTSTTYRVTLAGRTVT